MVKAAIIQLNSQPDKSMNLAKVKSMIEQAVTIDNAQLITLPELFNFYGGPLEQRKEQAERLSPALLVDAYTYQTLKELAQAYRVLIHAGSILEAADGHYFNTTLVFSPSGEELARYRKIHLFDVTAPNGDEYKESKILSHGANVVTYTYQNLTIGCAICYDLRFAELFLNFAQAANVIIIPSAFTYQTGQAHWEILLRARAIETQCYIIAPAQTGIHPTEDGTKRTWGHSMIIDPWGKIITKLEDEVGYAVAELDLNYINEVRQRMPIAQHRRL